MSFSWKKKTQNMPPALSTKEKQRESNARRGGGSDGIGKGGEGSPSGSPLSSRVEALTDSTYTYTASASESVTCDGGHRPGDTGYKLSRFLPKTWGVRGSSSKSSGGDVPRRRKRSGVTSDTDAGRPRVDDGPNSGFTSRGAQARPQKQPSWRAVRILRECYGSGGTIGALGVIQETDWWRNKSSSSVNTGASAGTTLDDQGDSFTANSSLRLYATASTSSAPSSSPSVGDVFFNVGFSVWEKSRAEWRRRKVFGATAEQDGEGGLASVSRGDDNEGVELEVLPSRKTLSNGRYDELVRGLIRNFSRAPYELPEHMPLGDIVGLFVDAWDCDDDI